MEEKLQAFADLLHKEQKERYVKDLDNIPAEQVEVYCKIHIRPGKKYVKIDQEGSGKYMVVAETGEIFGIKGYGVIHKGHAYGTLDTINEWYWGSYKAAKKVNA